MHEVAAPRAKEVVRVVAMGHTVMAVMALVARTSMSMSARMSVSVVCMRWQRPVPMREAVGSPAAEPSQSEVMPGRSGL